MVIGYIKSTHFCYLLTLTIHFVSKAQFDIPEASNKRKKKKIQQTVGQHWRQFKSDLTSKWALAKGKEEDNDKVCEKYGFRKEKWNQLCQSRRDPSQEVSCGPSTF